MLIFGSDSPGTNAARYFLSPVYGLYAAVTRQTLAGEPKEGWFPDQRLTIEEATRGVHEGPRLGVVRGRPERDVDAGQARGRGRLRPQPYRGSENAPGGTAQGPGALHDNRRQNRARRYAVDPALTPDQLIIKRLVKTATELRGAGAPGKELDKQRWERETLEPALKKSPERPSVHDDLRPADRAALHRRRPARPATTAATSAIPGEFPYTRGIHPTGYRGKLWTMRQFAGFGTPEETNARYKQLLAAGGTGLSVAFDLPTLMGRDPDHELSLGEVGKCGVNVASLADMETLFDGIPLGDITTSMTINSPAAMIFAMYLVVAEQQGADWKTLSGHDPERHPQGVHRAEGVHLSRRGRRCGSSPTSSRSARRRCRGGTRSRSAATTSARRARRRRRSWRSRCATASSTCSAGVDAGLDVDDFAPRMSFFFNAHSDFFEEIAKYRAARRIWAQVMRDRFGAKNERSWKLRFHTQTAGVSLTAQQPYNNVVRTALQALAAVLGGTQLAAHQLARRGARAADGRGGDARAAHAADHRARERRDRHRRSARRLVLRREADARHGRRGASRTSTRSIAMGGMVAAIEQRLSRSGRSPRASYRFQQAVERKEKIIVGVNDFVQEDEPPIAILYIDESAGEHAAGQARGAAGRRATTAAVARALDALRDGARRRRQHDAAAPRRACAPTPRSARCATRCARSGASTKKCRSI